MENLEQYCELDLYDKYVDFEKEYATDVLRNRRDDERGRRAFIRTFKIYDRKKFWTWFNNLSSDEQEERRTEWEIGYEEFIKREIEKSRIHRKHILQEIDEVGEEEFFRRLNRDREEYN